MKKFLSFFLLLALTLGMLSGCSNSDASSNDDERIQVVTSFYPIYDFTQKVGQDNINLINLVPAGTEPHDWEPSVNDVINLEQADIFIYNGANMEPWVEKLVSSLENKDLIVVEASQGLVLLDEEENDADGHDHGDLDPHVWLSIPNAIEEMRVIKEALVYADPKNQAQYEENFQVYSAQFEELHQEYLTQLSQLERRDIVVSHAAFGYLCHEYDLHQVAIDGLAADSEPSMARMAEIVTFVKENNVTTIFFEELVSPKVAQTIANEAGVTTAVLNPIEGLTKEQVEAGEDYLSVMQQNLNVLVEALS